MLYTLKVKKISNQWHDHYATLNQLFVGIDEVVDKRNTVGGYATFSPTGNCSPVDIHETVLTIFHGDEIVCPTSAGGDRSAYDNYRKLKEVTELTINI